MNTCFHDNQPCQYAHYCALNCETGRAEACVLYEKRTSSGSPYCDTCLNAGKPACKWTCFRKLNDHSKTVGYVAALERGDIEAQRTATEIRRRTPTPYATMKARGELAAFRAAQEAKRGIVAARVEQPQLALDNAVESVVSCAATDGNREEKEATA